MNILITCPGRRVRTLEILKSEFAKSGLGVIAAGNSRLVAGLYAADQGYLVPSIHDSKYIPRLLEICRQDDVRGIVTMLDEDVLVLAQAADHFRQLGVVPIVCDYQAALKCDDKFEMYRYLESQGFKCPLTYRSMPDFMAAYENHEIDFPVFIKPVVGTGSRGAMQCQSLEELKLIWASTSDLIIQEYMDGTEYSLDTYIDTISKKMVRVFCKQKIQAMNGTFVRAVSVKDYELFSLAERLAESVGAIGALDIEVFGYRGEYYVCEINARMGGGYFTGHICGVNFVPLIVNNVNGIENISDIGNYEAGILILRYDRVLTIPPERSLS